MTERRNNDDMVMIYRDNYESGTTLEFDTNIVGNGSITRSTDTAYSGDTSIKSIIGSNSGDYNEIIYNHTDFHHGKIRTQIRFASKSDRYEVDMETRYFDGKGNCYIGKVGFRDNIFKLLNIELNDIFMIIKDIRAWNTIELVIDTASKTYVYGKVNIIKHDLICKPLEIKSVDNRQHIENRIITKGNSTIVYLDNYELYEEISFHSLKEK